MSLALLGMRRRILPLLTLCASLPMRDGSQDLAGPPFDLDPAVLEFSAGSAPADRHLELLDRLATHYAAIEAAPQFSAPHKTELANLRSYDQRRRNLFS